MPISVSLLSFTAEVYFSPGLAWLANILVYDDEFNEIWATPSSVFGVSSGVIMLFSFPTSPN